MFNPRSSSLDYRVTAWTLKFLMTLPHISRTRRTSRRIYLLGLNGLWVYYVVHSLLHVALQEVVCGGNDQGSDRSGHGLSVSVEMNLSPEKLCVRTFSKTSKFEYYGAASILLVYDRIHVDHPPHPLYSKIKNDLSPHHFRKDLCFVCHRTTSLVFR